MYYGHHSVVMCDKSVDKAPFQLTLSHSHKHLFQFSCLIENPCTSSASEIWLDAALDYCSMVWDPHTANEFQLEMVKHYAAICARNDYGLHSLMLKDLQGTGPEINHHEAFPDDIL